MEAAPSPKPIRNADHTISELLGALNAMAFQTNLLAHAATQPNDVRGQAQRCCAAALDIKAFLQPATTVADVATAD